jgi:hypothetical protein
MSIPYFLNSRQLLNIYFSQFVRLHRWWWRRASKTKNFICVLLIFLYLNTIVLSNIDIITLLKLVPSIF